MKSIALMYWACAVLENEILKTLKSGTCGTVGFVGTTAAVGAVMCRYLGFRFEEYYIYFSFDLSFPAQIRKKTESAGLNVNDFEKIVSKHDVVIGMQLGEYFATHSSNVRHRWVKTTREGLRKEDAHQIT